MAHNEPGGRAIQKDISSIHPSADEVMVALAAPEDLPEIVRIEQASFSDSWSLKGFEDALRYSYSTMLCAKLGNAVVGYCCLYQVLDEGEIVNVAVAPEHRSRGIGRIMLDQLIARGKAKGVSRFLLDVRLSNLPAIRLYEGAGFKKLAVQKNFYENPSEDAWLMELA